MKTTDKLAVVALAIGIAAGVGVYYFLPGAHWAVPVVAGILVGGGAYGGMIKQTADERIADRDLKAK